MVNNYPLCDLMEEYKEKGRQSTFWSMDFMTKILQPYFQRQEQEEGRQTIDSLFRSSLQCLYGFRFYVIYHINSSCQTQVIDLFRQKNYFGGS